MRFITLHSFLGDNVFVFVSLSLSLSPYLIYLFISHKFSVKMS